MPPWPACCLLLQLLFLMAGCSELHLRSVNPWLSAADTRAVTAGGSDAAHQAATLCPPPCSNNNNNNKNMTQCLYYLQESHKEEVCGREIEPERRRARLHGLRMRHCCEHAVDGALPEAAFHDGPICKRLLEGLLQIDRIANSLSYGHSELLTRYDCAQNYSIAHDCKDCKVKILAPK